MESPKLSDEPWITPVSSVNQYRLQELIVIMLMSATLVEGGGEDHINYRPGVWLQPRYGWDVPTWVRREFVTRSKKSLNLFTSRGVTFKTHCSSSFQQTFSLQGVPDDMSTIGKSECTVQGVQKITRGTFHNFFLVCTKLTKNVFAAVIFQYAHKLFCYNGNTYF